MPELPRPVSPVVIPTHDEVSTARWVILVAARSILELNATRFPITARNAIWEGGLHDFNIEAEPRSKPTE